MNFRKALMTRVHAKFIDQIKFELHSNLRQSTKYKSSNNAHFIDVAIHTHVLEGSIDISNAFDAINNFAPQCIELFIQFCGSIHYQPTAGTHISIGIFISVRQHPKRKWNAIRRKIDMDLMH